MTVWAEADLDRAMKRTANRPFAPGRFRAGAGWLAAILALLALAVAAAYWSANGWAAAYTFRGAFVYAIAGVFILAIVRLAQAPSPKRAIQNFFASLIQFMLLVGGALASRLSGSF